MESKTDYYSKISVIVPIYNVKSYVEQCIQSLCTQSYTNLEIILVDDGSTDGSGDICDEFEKNDERIIVIHKENVGLVAARKTGLKAATGEYICCVDGDDYVATTMCEELLSIAHNTQADIIHTGYIYDGKKNIPHCFDVAGLTVEQIKSNVKELFFSNSNCRLHMTHNICGKMFKNNVLNDAYKYVPDNQSYGEDLLCLMESVCRGARIVAESKAFYYYRKRQGSITQKVSTDYLLREMNLYDAMLLCLQRNGIDGEELIAKCDERLNKMLLAALEKKMVCQQYVVHYILPDFCDYPNKRIILYGAGLVGKSYYIQMQLNRNYDICAWVDKDYQRKSSDFIEIESPDVIDKKEYDYIIIALVDKMTAMQVREYLISKGVDEAKILWEEPRSIWKGISSE